MNTTAVGYVLGLKADGAVTEPHPLSCLQDNLPMNANPPTFGMMCSHSSNPGWKLGGEYRGTMDASKCGQLLSLNVVALVL